MNRVSILTTAAAVAILNNIIITSVGATVIGVPAAEYYNVVVIYTPNGEIGPGSVRTPTDLSFSALGASVSTTNVYGIPTLLAQVNAPLPASVAGIGGTAQSILDYYFRINGPTPTVPVNLQAFGYVSFSPGTMGIGNANIIFNGAQYISCLSNDSSCGSYSSTLNLNKTLSLYTDSLYTVEMQATLLGINGGQASAFIDPMFTVPLGYTIDISNGIGNSLGTTTTPVPATLPLFASGLGLFAWFGRRRRNEERERCRLILGLRIA